MLIKLLAILALLFDAVALGFVIFAGVALLHHFFTSPKVKKAYALSDKHYHELRRHFVHRIIISLDFFIVADLIKLSYIATTNSLLQILLIVIIRTTLSHFLLKHTKG